jgi:hypothetical protein
MPEFRVHWTWFIIAFASGVLYLYAVRPTPLKVYKYPTPYNAGKVVYSDHAGNCYKFNMETLKCSKDQATEPQPIV